MAPCADLLKQLTAPFGVFGVLGNHDDDVEMPRELKRRGVEMLNDARTTVTIRGETLDLIGLRFWTRQTSDLARLMRGGTTTTMLLAHDPRRIVQAAALNVPLMLSGHTHGGQIVIPGIGALGGPQVPRDPGHRRGARTPPPSSAAASARSTFRAGSTVRRKWRCSRCAGSRRRSQARRPDPHQPVLSSIEDLTALAFVIRRLFHR